MKINVSDIVRKVVSSSGKRQISIAKDVSLSTVQLRKILKDNEIEMKHVLAIGKSINYDFSRHFPELNSEKLNNILREPEGLYDKMGNTELKNNMIELQGRYITLLEQHIKLLNDFNELKK